MMTEGRQKPMYYVAEASRIDNINISISQKRFNAKIMNLLKDAEQSLQSSILVLI